MSVLSSVDRGRILKALGALGRSAASRPERLLPSQIPVTPAQISFAGELRDPLAPEAADNPTTVERLPAWRAEGPSLDELYRSLLGYAIRISQAASGFITDAEGLALATEGSPGINLELSASLLQVLKLYREMAEVPARSIHLAGEAPMVDFHLYSFRGPTGSLALGIQKQGALEREVDSALAAALQLAEEVTHG